MATYITRQGDAWDLIAYKLFGAERYMKEMIEANRQYAEVFVFSGGVELEVPELTLTADSSTLPGWRTEDE